MLIDTHSHINVDKLADILPEILKNLEVGPVGLVVCPSFSYESTITSLGLAKDTPRVFAGLGVHPENAQEYNDEVEEFLLAHAMDKKVVAIGEIGLDYHYGFDSKAEQFEALNRQIDIANKFDLPVIFHVRDAFDDFFDWLRKNRSRFNKGVIHCFDGGPEIAKRLLDFDLHISITGLVTFPPREDIREAVKIIPLNKLMVETDAPYLAPVPYRGQLNRPEYVEEVAKKIAEVKGVSLKEIEEATTRTAFEFFSKMEVENE